MMYHGRGPTAHPRPCQGGGICSCFIQIGGEGYPFVGNWSTKGLYAYRSGQYNGIAYFGNFEMPHLKSTVHGIGTILIFLPTWEKLVQLEDDDSTSIAEPSRYPPAATEPHIEAPSIDIDEGKITQVQTSQRMTGVLSGIGHCK